MQQEDFFDNELKKQLMSNLHHPSFNNHLERYVLANQLRLLRIMSMNLDMEIVSLLARKNNESEEYITGKIDANSELADQCLSEIMKMIYKGSEITAKIREMDKEIPWTI